MLRRLAQTLKNRIYPSPNHPLRRGKNGHFIFIHINKTAGTSIAKAIGLPRINHLTAQQIIQITSKKRWSAAFKFTVVRNPWDRVVSHYKYRVKTNQTQLGESPISFHAWVACTYGQPKNPLYYDKPIMFQPQVDWLKNEANEIEIDAIIRFENLENDFAEIAEIIGVNPNLPHLKASQHDHYRTFYDETTRAIVGEWFREDIAYFGYEF